MGIVNIPEEAVEAAAKAWDHYWGDRYGDEALEEMGEEVTVALNAAAPFIAAQALREAAGNTPCPWEVTLPSVRNWLHNRAATIEAGN